jgi:diguanylate cyclase (GGDEF)-like protein
MERVMTSSDAKPFEAPALLDALPDATAVLDHDGTIVAVNRAWRMFAIDNGGSPESTGVGINYLDVCARAAAAGCADAGAVEAGLRAVLNGDTVECDMEYPCPAPSAGRWFVLRITQIGGPEMGALISHVNITRRKIAEQQLERKASEDPLTGLANRVLFAERLSHALTLRPGREPRADVGILFIDLDHFKKINDTFGHAAGDDVLQAVAGRLKTLARTQDTVARLGGDEFAVLVPRTSADGLAAFVKRIAAAFRQPHAICGTALETSASIGTHLAIRGEDAAAALRRADEAMYAVKHASRKKPPAIGTAKLRGAAKVQSPPPDFDYLLLA